MNKKPRTLAIISSALLAIWLFSSCSTANPPETSTSTPRAAETPLPADPAPPLPTMDADAQPYLENVGAVLRHSAVVVKDRVVGIPDACPGQYLLAFPYTEPDQRGGMTIAVTGLNRRDDGSVIMGEHHMLWGLKGEGMDPERCKDIFIQNLSEPGLIRISFQVQHPDDRSWRIGVASGPCPGIELWLAAYFYLHNPDDFDFHLTQFSPDSPVDYWLRDGNRLSLYQWEPWQETLLWRIEDTPGKLLGVDWDESSLDLTGDGEADLLLTWEVNGNQERWIYIQDGLGFSFVEIEN